MQEGVTPLNRQFSDVSVFEPNNYSEYLGNDHGSGGFEAAGNKKTKEDMKEILSNLKRREIGYTRIGLGGEVLQTV